jgi:hypothetical protein
VDRNFWRSPEMATQKLPGRRQQSAFAKATAEAFAWVQLRLGEASRSSDQVFLARERRLVSLTFASWNQIHGWLKRLEGLREAA